MSDEIKKLLVLLLQTFIDELDIEKVEDIAAKVYDQYIKPLDLPGPDEVIDPVLRQAFIWSACAIVKAIRRQVIADRQGNAS